MKILIVDDDSVLLEQLRAVLKEQRYIIETAKNGEQALEKLFSEAYDLLVLDVMMPGLDGLDVLREARSGNLDMPVLMLSAKGDIEDRIRGLDLGADDYLSKPFSLNELLARVRALLRRRGGGGDSVLRMENLALDTVSRTIEKEGVPVELTPKEFAILEFLLHNKGRVVSRLILAEHIWQDDFDPFSMSNSMDVHIKNLRRKIGDNAREGMIRTVRGVGYLLKDAGS